MFFTKLFKNPYENRYASTKSLLKASGITGNKQNSYLSKMEGLVSDFFKSEKITSELIDELAESENLYHLGNTIGKKILNYIYRDSDSVYTDRCLFHEVIDAKINKNSKIGNCVGLSSLYHTLAESIGVQTVPVLTENHAYISQENLDIKINVETTEKNGFNVIKNYKYFQEEPKGLESAIYIARYVESTKNKTEQIFQEWKQMLPEDSTIIFLEGMKHFNRNEYDTAADFFKKSMEKGIINANCSASYATCLLKLGDSMNARYFAQQSLKMDSNNEKAKKIIEITGN